MVPATSKTVENSHFMVLVTNRRIHKEVEMFCDCGVPIKKENRVFGFGKNRVFGFAKNRVFGFKRPLGLEPFPKASICSFS
jgi:hypothetical protein